ncbi:MAG: winged helix-turn-helix domain-containing protein [Candidatus Bathyarchaeia archaeon]
MGERKRRSKKEIICEILSEALNGANKTRLMYRCNLNLERFNYYLRELLKAKLLECITPNPSGITIFKTTDKGKELLKILQRADELFSI